MSTVSRAAPTNSAPSTLPTRRSAPSAHLGRPPPSSRTTSAAGPRTRTGRETAPDGRRTDSWRAGSRRAISPRAVGLTASASCYETKTRPSHGALPRRRRLPLDTTQQPVEGQDLLQGHYLPGGDTFPTGHGAGWDGAVAGVLHDRGFHPTGVFWVFGAVAGASLLPDLPPAAAVSPLGIVGGLASSLFEFVADGTLTKRLHPGWAAHSGIVATRLACERRARGDG